MVDMKLRTYEQLVKEEEDLIKKIETCDECMTAIFSVVYSKADSIHTKIILDIINVINITGKDLQTELVQLIIDKKLVAKGIDVIRAEEVTE